MKRTILMSAMFVSVLACKPKVDEPVQVEAPAAVEVQTEVLAAPAPAPVKKVKKHHKKKAPVAAPCVPAAAPEAK